MSTLKTLKSSVDKTFTVLEQFTALSPEWSVTELAKQLDSNKSTVYRFLSDMESRGVLYKNPDSGRYGLGLKLFERGIRVQIKPAFIDKTHPVLEKVAKSITETVHIGVLKNIQVYYLDEVESPQGLRISATIGSYSPSHATSLGKVLLSFSDKISFSKSLKAYTKNAITRSSELVLELKKIEKQGYAVDYEELEIGLICVAVPIFNQKNEIVASLSAAGPANRFKEAELPDYVKKIQEGASEIQKNIGNFRLNFF